MGVKSTSQTQPYHERFRETQGGVVSVSATGGISVVDGDDRYNVFTSSDTFTLSNGPVTAKVLIVSGGGGGGGIYYAGGGGAGGIVYGASVELSNGDYAVVIGSGGAGGIGGERGTNGVDSSFNSVTAKGGGGGGAYSSNGVASPGGSSGGNSGYHPTPRVAVTPQPVPGDYTAYGNLGGGGGGYGGGRGGRPGGGKQRRY